MRHQTRFQLRSSSAGSNTVNAVPFPGALTTCTSPPCRVTTVLTKAMPEARAAGVRLLAFVKAPEALKQRGSAVPAECHSPDRESCIARAPGKPFTGPIVQVMRVSGGLYLTALFRMLTSARVISERSAQIQ